MLQSASALAQSIDTRPEYSTDGSSYFENISFCATLYLAELAESKDAMREFQLYKHKYSDQNIELVQTYSTYSVGNQKNFTVYNFRNTRFETKTFELRGIGNITLIWVESGHIGSGKVTDFRVNEIISYLEVTSPTGSHNPDNGILANNLQIFGNPPNVDQSGMVNVLFTEIETAQSNIQINGYVTSVNLSLTNPNSNKSDIVYINTRLVYRNDQLLPINLVLSTIAHEHQHLIHYNYNRLNTFQNEGQSEWAEVINGFLPRPATNLNSSDELNRNLYTWRTSSSEVLFDYSRAGLFHEYVSERIGVSATGSITRAPASGRNAYQFAMGAAALQVEDILLDFHTANLLNYAHSSTLTFPVYSYSNPSRANVRSTGVSIEYPTFLLDVSNSGTVHYGGADVRRWNGASDFSIILQSPTQVIHRIIGKSLNSGNYEILTLQNGFGELAGDFEYVLLLSVKNSISGNNEISEGASTFSYTAQWNPVPVQNESLVYHEESAFFAELPGDPEIDNRRNIRKFATRFRPAFSGKIEEIRFDVSSNAAAVRGSGLLQISLHRVQSDGIDQSDGQTRLIPGTLLYQKSIPIDFIASGRNTAYPHTPVWEVTQNTEYYLVFEVINHSPDARIEFLIDAGTISKLDPRYNPARSRVFISGGSPAWVKWQNNNNFLISTRITGIYDGPLEQPHFTIFPESAYTVSTGSLLEVQVEATGIPAPLFAWTRNGQLVQPVGSPILRLDAVRKSDEGHYEVRAVNLAGATEIRQFQVSTVTGEFELAQNYPNPFNSGTTIEFTLVSQGSASVRIFDITGRLIATLIDNETLDEGLHRLRFDGAGLASGIYLYSIDVNLDADQAGSMRSTRKMLLIR